MCYFLWDTHFSICKRKKVFLRWGVATLHSKTIKTVKNEQRASRRSFSSATTLKVSFTMLQMSVATFSALSPMLVNVATHKKSVPTFCALITNVSQRRDACFKRYDALGSGLRTRRELPWDVALSLYFNSALILYI